MNLADQSEDNIPPLKHSQVDSFKISKRRRKQTIHPFGKTSKRSSGRSFEEKRTVQKYKFHAISVAMNTLKIRK